MESSLPSNELTIIINYKTMEEEIEGFLIWFSMIHQNIQTGNISWIVLLYTKVWNIWFIKCKMFHVYHMQENYTMQTGLVVFFCDFHLLPDFCLFCPLGAHFIDPISCILSTWPPAEFGQWGHRHNSRMEVTEVRVHHLWPVACF